MFRLKHYFANLVINGNSAFKLHYVQIKTNVEYLESKPKQKVLNYTMFRLKLLV